MANDLKLQVLLAAIDKASGPFKKIQLGSKGTTAALRASQAALKKLNAAQHDIDGFRTLETQLGQTSNQLTQAQRKLALLGAEVNASESPSRKLTTALRRQARAVGELNEKQTRLRAKLTDSRAALDANGMSSSRLALHQRKLTGDIEQANRAIDEQKRRLWKLHQVRERAAKMHSGGMTAAAHGAGAAFAGTQALMAGGVVMGAGMDFESALRDISITGGFSRAQEAQLAAQIRADAKRYGQFTDVISQGLGNLVANGISAQEDLEFYSGLLAKGSVATGAQMIEMSNLTVSLQRNLGIMKEGVVGAFDSMAYAGKQGSFELKDMAKWFPELTPQMKALGVTGRDAVNQLGAALQVARLGAGDSAQAANNLKNYLAKIVSPETVGHFDKAGIDLQARLMELQTKGIGPLHGSLQLITEYMASKGPQAAQQFKDAIALKDDAQRQAALEQLASAYALGDLFRDQQAMAFIRPALANLDLLQRIEAGAAKASGGIDKDWAARMDTGRKQFDLFKIKLADLGLQASAILMPALNSLAQSLGTLFDRISAFAREHPALTAGLLKLAVAGVAVVTVLGGLLVVGGMAAMAFSQIHNAVVLLSGGGGMAGLMTNLRALAGNIIPAVLNAGRALLLVLGGITWPMLAIAALIALVAAVVWKFWGPIKAFMVGVWQGVMEAMAPLREALAPLMPVWDAFAAILGKVWGWIKQLFTPFQATSEQLENATSYGRTFGRILGTVVVAPVRLLIGAIGLLWKALKFVFDWSPLGLIINNWTAITDFFAGLRTRFAEIGRNLLQGLVGGLLGGLANVRDTIVSAGAKITGWFKDKLGIRSPSRVFAQLGDYTMAGLAGGLTRSQRLPLRALDHLAGGMRRVGAGIALTAAAAPAVAIDNRPPVAPAAVAASTAAPTYNITINAGAGSQAQDIAQLVRAEIERLELERAARSRSRLSDDD